ncbi:hypothetical protein ACLJYM_10760 [Rhizobium giardinii]|uniref:hypothetical protein n=1 Tax=Rhizobium giardinii TaxID=56731 RepID=UPI0039DFC3EC
MTGLYSEKSLNELAEAREKWLARNDELMEEVVKRSYRTAVATEYAQHGLARRLKSLSHNSTRLFELIPPDIETAPTLDITLDATAFVHSFISNTYGAIDNLARIWCHEKGVKNGKGKPIADGHIGLRQGNTTVRESLSQEFQDYLTKSDPWFEYLENYRHAVAHRIPIYIPPKTLNKEQIAESERLEIEGAEALKAGDTDKYWLLFGEQRKLGEFKPYMMHSFGERAKPVAIHGQMVCDMATVVEIGELMLKELDNLTP